MIDFLTIHKMANVMASNQKALPPYILQVHANKKVAAAHTWTSRICYFLSKVLHILANTWTSTISYFLWEVLHISAISKVEHPASAYLSIASTALSWSILPHPPLIPHLILAAIQWIPPILNHYSCLWLACTLLVLNSVFVVHCLFWLLLWLSWTWIWSRNGVTTLKPFYL